MRSTRHLDEPHHLLAFKYREQARRSQEHLLAVEVVEQGATSADPSAPVRGALPGDRAKLRGIPITGVHGGLGGTILGTNPEQAAMLSDQDPRMR